MRSFLLFAIVCTAFARDGPAAKGRAPLMGWNTWCTQNTCGVDWCTSAEVLDVAAAIKKSGMQAAGYDHINLDDCWGVRNQTSGEIMGDPSRFPEGMPAFIAKIHELGFKFGLYTDIGVNGCHHPFVGSWPDYQRDADTFAKWDVDYVKFDGCDQPAVADAETLTCNMSQALNNTGRDMWLNFHCWHNENCARCGNSFRVFSDHHDNWESTQSVIKFLAENRQPFWGPDPDYGWPDADFVYTGGQGCGSHSAPGIRCQGQTNVEYISEYSIWAIAQGQIVVATDPRNMTDFMREVLMNKEVIEVFKDVSGFRDVIMKPYTPPTPSPKQCSVSLKHQLSHSECSLQVPSFGCDGSSMWTDHGCRGMFTCNGLAVTCDVDGEGKHTCPCVPEPSQVWLRPLAGGRAAVVLHNPGAQDATIRVSFSDVPKRKWNKSTNLKVRDLWKQADLGTFTGFYEVKSVPSHGSVFLTLSS